MFVEEDLDPFDFELAAVLGRTVDELYATISNPEYLSWRALSAYRKAKAEMT